MGRDFTELKENQKKPQKYWPQRPVSSYRCPMKKLFLNVLSLMLSTFVPFLLVSPLDATWVVEAWTYTVRLGECLGKQCRHDQTCMG